MGATAKGTPTRYDVMTAFEVFQIVSETVKVAATVSAFEKDARAVWETWIDTFDLTKGPING